MCHARPLVVFRAKWLSIARGPPTAGATCQKCQAPMPRCKEFSLLICSTRLLASAEGGAKRTVIVGGQAPHAWLGARLCMEIEPPRIQCIFWPGGLWELWLTPAPGTTAGGLFYIVYIFSSVIKATGFIPTAYCFLKVATGTTNPSNRQRCCIEPMGLHTTEHPCFLLC